MTRSPNSAPHFETAARKHQNFGIADPEKLKGMRGIEQLHGIQSGDLPAPPMAQIMNVLLHQVEAGRVDLRGEPGQEHLNPMGIVHGGWTMSFLDSVLGFAVHTTLEAGETYVSLGTEVKFIRPLFAGTGQVRALGELVTRGKRTATAMAKVEDQQGRIIATGTSTCFIQPLP